MATEPAASTEQSTEQSTVDRRFFYADVPADQEVLAALGVVIIRHTHLEFMLRRVIKTLADLTTEQADNATMQDNVATLRRLIRKLGRQRLGEGPALLRLRDLLRRCEQATEARNEFLHSVYGRELDGDLYMLDRNRQWRRTPTVEELNELSARMKALFHELDDARMTGFIQEAMQARKRLATD